METTARYHARGFIINIEGEEGTQIPAYIQELANQLFKIGEHIRVVSLKKDYKEAVPALKKGAILLIERYCTFYNPEEHSEPDITIYLKRENPRQIRGTKANLTDSVSEYVSNLQNGQLDRITKEIQNVIDGTYVLK